jgi:hypothetical protein
MAMAAWKIMKMMTSMIFQSFDFCIIGSYAEQPD